jgi:hypothetical protein
VPDAITGASPMRLRRLALMLRFSYPSSGNSGSNVTDTLTKVVMKII